MSLECVILTNVSYIYYGLGRPIGNIIIPQKCSIDTNPRSKDAQCYSLLSIAIFVTHFDPDIIVSTISEILLNCRATNLGFGSKRIDRIGKIVSLQTKFEICMPHCLTIVSVL